MRIFFGMSEICGFYSNMKAGLEERGISCTHITLAPHRFEYSNEVPTRAVRYLHFTRRKCEISKSFFSKKFWKFLNLVLRVDLFLSIAFTHDVFVFSGGQSFFRRLDLKILKWFRKKLIFIYHGSDIRPCYVDGGRFQTLNQADVDATIRWISEHKKMVEFWEETADVILNHPPQSYYQTKPFLQFLAVGIPFAMPEHDAKTQKTDQESIRILHAPSLPEAKGTLEIRAIIQKLKSSGWKIDFVEISGMPHAQVLDEIQKCDFVIDELYSDTPMASFSTEAAYFGKPAVVCGYYAEEISKNIPSEFLPPSLFTLPEKAEAAILMLVSDQEKRLALGKKVQEFVQKQWNRKAVIDRFLQILDGNVPASWYFDPLKLNYAYGAGISDVKLRRNIGLIIEAGGPSSLGLDHNPQLRNTIIEAIQKTS